MSSSAASKKAERLEKKLQSQLRACQKLPGNKRCADCTERVSGTTSVLCSMQTCVESTIVCVASAQRTPDDDLRERKSFRGFFSP